MYTIDQPDPPPGFQNAWHDAGVHLQHQMQDDMSWIRAYMFKPLVEHLSFRIGNQIFWIFLELEQNGNVILPFSGVARAHFLRKAAEANILPCVMPLEHKFGKWITKLPGWGLRHAETGELLNPFTEVTDEVIVMSDWEAHDMAIQVVRDHLTEQGKEILSLCSYLDINPSIWFQDESGIHWVVVREVVYPRKEAEMPENIDDIGHSCAAMSDSGFFASVSLANSNDEFLGEESALPLYRGHGIRVRFKGLNAIP